MSTLRRIHRWVGPHISIEIAVYPSFKDIVRGKFTADAPPRVAAIVEVRKDMQTVAVWGDAEDIPDGMLYLIQSGKIDQELFFDIVAVSTIMEALTHPNGKPTKKLSREAAQAIIRYSHGEIDLDTKRPLIRRTKNGPAVLIDKPGPPKGRLNPCHR